MRSANKPIKIIAGAVKSPISPNPNAASSLENPASLTAAT